MDRIHQFISVNKISPTNQPWAKHKKKRKARDPKSILHKINWRVVGCIVLLFFGLAFLGVGIGVIFLIRDSQNLYAEITCTPDCLNNGTCVAKNVCRCPTGYNGTICQNPICNQTCVHGNCTAPNFCTCVNGYYGSTCATPNCSIPCQNGGVCTAPNTCQCTQNVWTGSYCQTPVQILWKFDNSLVDFYNNYPGTGMNTPTYRSPGINGYGTCLYLTASFNQSVTVSSPPFLNMESTSFSLTSWVKPTSLRNGASPNTDNAIFGQHTASTRDRSLHIVARNRKPFFGFYSDDSAGIVTMSTNTWYHLSFVYDYASLNQYIYVNGVLDVNGTSKGPYQGTSGDFTIGTSGIYPGRNYWDGCIDEVAFVSRAKNETEILREATLTVSYQFENSAIDIGPLSINGTASGVSFSSSGRVNSCVFFATTPAYVQATGLILLGTRGQSYSISIWINPAVVNRGTIVHVSSGTNGLGWCIPMLGFTSASAIGVQSWNAGSMSFSGPTIATNVWTHITVTYASTVGLRLWVNGTQHGSGSIPFTFAAANGPVAATLGSSLSGSSSCSAGVIAMGQYSGYMDEFKLYSRELSASDIFNLANP